MTDRDYFAAAAFPCCHEEIYREGQLTGYAADWREQIVRQAYAYADAMLRERDNHPAKPDSSTNHDAAPAARADAKGRDHPDTPDHVGTGNQPAPPSVETDGFSPGSRTGPINRTPERESPRRECGESSLRDVARPDTKGKVAGGPEHHISEAEIDALEYVVEECRIANIHDYGILRSMLIRLRREWEFRDSPEPVKDAVSDRSEPVKDAVSDRSEPVKDAVSDRSEPIRIDLSQPCMVDPPSGWQWGFPKRYDPAEDGPMKEWLVRNGYPKHLADKGLPCTFTLCGNGEADK